MPEIVEVQTIDPVLLNRIRVIAGQLKDLRTKRETLILELAKVENEILECNNVLQGIAQMQQAKRKQGPVDLRPSEVIVEHRGSTTRTTLKYDQ